MSDEAQNLQPEATTPSIEAEGATTPSLISDPQASAETQPEVPVTLEQLQLPEGFELPEDRQGPLLEFINENKISPEIVNKFLALSGNWSKTDTEAAAQAQAQAWVQTQTQWADEIRNDPEYGGDKLAGHLSGIADLIDEFTRDSNGNLNPEAAAALRSDFNMTGAGNRLSMVKFLSAIAKATLVSEGSIQPAGSTPPASVFTGLYPHLNKG